MPRLRLPSAESPVWYHTLLVTLLVAMLCSPLALTVDGWGDELLQGVTILVFIACGCAMGKGRGSRVLAWVIFVPAALFVLISPERDSAPRIAGEALSAFLMLLVCVRIVERIFKTREVEWSTISGAIAVFLLLAAVWTRAYSAAAWSLDLEPAFNGVPTASVLHAATDLSTETARLESLLSYFSVVPLTTLGYGDVSPAHPVTRALASTQAVVGQLYLVVLVARLVSMHTQARRSREDSAGTDSAIE